MIFSCQITALFDILEVTMTLIERINSLGNIVHTSLHTLDHKNSNGINICLMFKGLSAYYGLKGYGEMGRVREGFNNKKIYGTFPIIKSE